MDIKKLFENQIINYNFNIKGRLRKYLIIIRKKNDNICNLYIN